jgi:hypothetical protein
MQLYLKGKETMHLGIWMKSKETPTAAMVMYKGSCVEDFKKLLLLGMLLHLVPGLRVVSYTSTPP